MIALIFFSLCFRLLLLQSPADIVDTPLGGYTDIVPYREGFVAVGSGGRCHQLSATGALQKAISLPDLQFVGATAVNNAVVAAAETGQMVQLRPDGTVARIDELAGKSLHCLVWFNRKVIAGSNSGQLYVGSENDNFESVRLAVKGDIIALSANARSCYGVTNQGEVIYSDNGTTWKIFDFNRVYKGYYKPGRFTAVLVSEKGIAIAGMNDEGLPVFYHSAKGQVWTETRLLYTDENGASQTLRATPNDIYYDGVNQSYYLACQEGSLMILPSCMQCNQLLRFPATSLSAISGNSEAVLVAGHNDYLQSFTPISLN